jgi:hypothetical protein
MKVSASIPNQPIICSVLLCLLIITTWVPALADTVITFDEYADGTNISLKYNGAYGVKFRGFGPYPQGEWGPRDHNAYAREDDHAFSIIGPGQFQPGGNVIGVSYVGSQGYTHLTWGAAAACAKFPIVEAPDYVVIYGVVDTATMDVFEVRVYDTIIAHRDLTNFDTTPYDVFYSNTDGTVVGNFNITPDVGDPYNVSIVMLEIDSSDLTTQQEIRTVAFGAVQGDHKVWFDNFTFGYGAPVPLPNSILLLGLGLMTFLGIRRKSQHKE